MNVPSRAFPAVFLILSAGSIAVTYGAPWMVAGSEFIPPDPTWANELFSGFGGMAPRPDMWGLAGGILGLSASIVWLALASLLPAERWTPAREAAVASLLAPSLFFLGAAGGMGIGMSIVTADGTTTAWSPAGIALAAIAGIGVVLLAAALLPRLPARRTPVYLLLGAVVAAALFQAVPWLTSTDPSDFGGDPDTTNTVRLMFRVFGADPLEPLGVAIPLLLLGALAWTLAVALLAPDVRRNAVVDGGFALAAFLPLTLAAIATGRILGASLAGLETFFGGGVSGALAGDGTITYAVNAYVFAALLVGAAIAVSMTLARSTRTLAPEVEP